MFPGSTLSDHILRFNNIPQVNLCFYLFLVFPDEKLCLDKAMWIPVASSMYRHCFGGEC